MGQYHYVVNLDKRQFLHPHKFDDGLKLMEFGRSGGGDRIVIIGDYAEADDLPAEFDAESLYDRCGAGEFTDISDVVVALLRDAGGSR